MRHRIHVGYIRNFSAHQEVTTEAMHHSTLDIYMTHEEEIVKLKSAVHKVYLIVTGEHSRQLVDIEYELDAFGRIMIDSPNVQLAREAYMVEYVDVHNQTQSFVTMHDSSEFEAKFTPLEGVHKVLYGKSNV